MMGAASLMLILRVNLLFCSFSVAHMICVFSAVSGTPKVCQS